MTNLENLYEESVVVKLVFVNPGIEIVEFVRLCQRIKNGAKHRVDDHLSPPISESSNCSFKRRHTINYYRSLIWRTRTSWSKQSGEMLGILPAWL